MKADLIRNEYLPFTNKTQTNVVCFQYLIYYHYLLKTALFADKEFSMKNVLIISFMICILIGCSKQEPRYYFGLITRMMVNKVTKMMN